MVGVQPITDAPLSRRRFLRVAGGAIGAAAGLASPAWGAQGRALTASTTQNFRTKPNLQPPEILVKVPPRGALDGVILTTNHRGPGQNGAMIIDRNGQLLWFNAFSKSGNGWLAFNLQVQSYQGKPVLTWFEGSVEVNHGAGHYVIVDQSYRQVAQVNAGNGYKGDLHEFLLTDRGTALFTCYGKATGNLPYGHGTRRGAYLYGVIQEVDVASGKVLFQWRSDHHIGFGDSYHAPPGSPSLPWDYFHINSIAIDPADGHLIVSARNTWACYKVHRQTGQVLWTMGGKHGNFRMGPNTHFAFQHHVVLHPGGQMTIFDNEGGPPNQAKQSRGLVLSVNESARRVSFVRQYFHNPSILSGALGSVAPMANGHAFVGWGESSYFTEYDGSGHVVFDARLGPGTITYRTFKQSWTGLPATDPDVVVVRGGGTPTVYVSWNGATEVARWQVLGGPSPQQLQPLTSAPRSGFETAIRLQQAPPWIAVAGIAADGTSLGRSAPTNA